jgi:protein-S-isoprenylcysteine O-methyltransferase Ste14
MSTSELLLRQATVFISALAYWAGVGVQARRIRRHIGRSPNVKPRGAKEIFLWVGWILVVLGWMIQPFLVGSASTPPWLRLTTSLPHWLTLIAGGLLIVVGHVGTLQCYAAMGDAWRMGVNRKEKNDLVTRGPYRRVRHPIYLFQVVLLAGAACLLPTVLSLVIMVVHIICVWIKALDEESYLLAVQGQPYRDYMNRTGRLVPASGQKGEESR